jgi:hypothetical protein
LVSRHPSEINRARLAYNNVATHGSITMQREIKYQPTGSEFSEDLGESLARQTEEPPVLTPSPYPGYRSPRGDPWLDYKRILTPEGSVLIYYRDLARGRVYAALRTAVWLVLTGIELDYFMGGAPSYMAFLKWIGLHPVSKTPS